MNLDNAIPLTVELGTGADSSAACFAVAEGVWLILLLSPQADKISNAKKQIHASLNRFNKAILHSVSDFHLIESYA
jgi:hypothetical protein